jgi:hypothetical protein
VGVPTGGDARVPVTGTSPKLVDLVHSYQFSMVLFVVFWLSWSSERSGKTGVRLRGPRQNSHILSSNKVKKSENKKIVGPGEFQTFREHRDPLMWNSPKLADFVHSYQFSVLLFNVFWLSWSSERSAQPEDRLRVPHENSQIFSVSASFLCVYSLILGLGSIQ